MHLANLELNKYCVKKRPTFLLKVQESLRAVMHERTINIHIKE